MDQDIADALEIFAPDFVIACNDAIAIWPGRLDAAVSLHPEKLAGWRNNRLAQGYQDAARYLVHGDYVPEWADLVEFRFPGQGDSGSSGLFMAKAALCDLGADMAVMAGVPLTRTPHFFDADTWEAAVGYRQVWQALRPEYRARIRSMSGWTAEEFGRPDGTSPAKEAAPMSKIIMDKVAYEPHPVSVARKRELNAQGFKVLDIRFAPAGAATPAAPEPVDGLSREGIATMAKADVVEWLSAHGANFDARWSVARLRAALIAAVFVDA